MLHKVPGAIFGLMIGLGLGLSAASLLNDLVNESREGLITAQRKVITYQAEWLESEKSGFHAQDVEIEALNREITALNHKADAYDRLIAEQRRGIDVRDRLLDERSAMIRTLKARANLIPSPGANQIVPQGSR